MGTSWAYAPYRRDLQAPGDRRRFCFWASQREVPFALVNGVSEADVVVLSARADIVRWSQIPRSGQRIVYDVVDSYLSVGPADVRRWLRGVGKYATGETRRPVLDYHRTMRRMCERADAVVCATEEQRQSILPFNENVHVILDALGELDDRQRVDFGRRDERELQVVWEGLPDTLGGFKAIRRALAELAVELPLRLHLVTNLEYHRLGGRIGRGSTASLARRHLEEFELYEWDLHTLPAIVSSCDLAVIPLDIDEPFFRGKPANKLLSFWQMGAPVLASATPAYGREMAMAGLPDTCATTAEWVAGLREMATSEERRREAARRGQEHVRLHHSDVARLLAWDGLFASLGVDR
jgi:hypothetical protein